MAVLRALLKAGADPRLKTPDGHMALKQMQTWKLEPAVEPLRSQGVREWEIPTRCIDTYFEKPRFARLSKDGHVRRYVPQPTERGQGRR